eukprot:5724471-Prymnesium_polylepis.3
MEIGWRLESVTRHPTPRPTSCTHLASRPVVVAGRSHNRHGTPPHRRRYTCVHGAPAMCVLGSILQSR